MTTVFEPNWTPTAFGNTSARDAVFQIIHGRELKLSSVEAKDCEETAKRVIAVAALQVAVAGDLQLLEECGFAIEFAQQNSGQLLFDTFVDADFTIVELPQILKDIATNSALRSFWKKKRQVTKFKQNVQWLVEQLKRFPKCRKSKFKKLTMKAARECLVRAGQSDLLGRSKVNGIWICFLGITPNAMIELGRFRDVRRLTFQFLTTLEQDETLDWAIKFGLQNWSQSTRTLLFNRAPVLTDLTGEGNHDKRFDFPPIILQEMEVYQPSVFEAYGFVATDEMVSAILSEKLTILHLDIHTVSPSIFDKIEERCPNLVRFYVEIGGSEPEGFADKAIAFQEKHPDVFVSVPGMW